MQRYRAALAFLNSALDEMVQAGELGIVADIAHPIGMIEREILSIQQRMFDTVPASEHAQVDQRLDTISNTSEAKLGRSPSRTSIRQ